MSARLCVAGAREQLPISTLRPLLVSGAHRAPQARRLRRPSFLIRSGTRVVAAAVWRHLGNEVRIDELGLVSARDNEELPDLVVDAIETVVLAAGAERLAVFTSSQALRRALRSLGYVPLTTGRRLGFVRHVKGVPETRQLVVSPVVTNDAEVLTIERRPAAAAELEE